MQSFKNSRRAFVLALLAAITLPIPVSGQQPSLKAQLVGAWGFIVTAANRKDGTRADVFGPTPNGIMIFHPDGHFAMINSKPGRAKYASGNRLQATPEEYKDTVLGTIAYFGSYTVDEGRKAFILKVKGSTFPDYEGAEQVRTFTIVGDELRFNNPSPTQGGPQLDLVLKRLSKVD